MSVLSDHLVSLLCVLMVIRPDGFPILASVSAAYLTLVTRGACSARRGLPSCLVSVTLSSDESQIGTVLDRSAPDRCRGRRRSLGGPPGQAKLRGAGLVTRAGPDPSQRHQRQPAERPAVQACRR